MIILILIIFLSALFILGTIALYVVPYLMDFYIKISKFYLFIPMGILLAIGILIFIYQFKYKEINYNQGQKQYDKVNSLGESNYGTGINQSRDSNWNTPSGNSSFQNENKNKGSFIRNKLFTERSSVSGSNTELSNNEEPEFLSGGSPPNNFFILYTIFITLSIVFCIILSIIITTSNKIIITNKKHENFQVDCNCNICKEYYAKPYNTY